MIPLLRLELRCFLAEVLREGAVMGLVLLILGLLFFRGFPADEDLIRIERSLDILKVPIEGILLLVPISYLYFARRMDPLALMVPLSPRRWAGARLAVLGAGALLAGAAIALISFPWSDPGDRHPVLHAVNWCSTVMAFLILCGSVIGIDVNPRTILRCLLLLVPAGAAAGLLVWQAIVPAPGWLSLVLVPSCLMLGWNYLGMQIRMELLPGPVHESFSLSRSFRALPAPGAFEPGFPHRIGPASCVLLKSLHRSGFLRVLILFSFLIASLSTLAFLLGSARVMILLVFLFWLWGFWHVSLRSWRSFLPTPFSRSRAFLVSLLPLLFLWTIWLGTQLFWAFRWNSGDSNLFGVDEFAAGAGRWELAHRALLDSLLVFLLQSAIHLWTLRYSSSSSCGLKLIAMILLLGLPALAMVLLDMGERTVGWITSIYRFTDGQPWIGPVLALACILMQFHLFRAFRRATLEDLPRPEGPLAPEKLQLTWSSGR